MAFRTDCIRCSSSLLLVKLLMATALSIIVCSASSCPRVHIYNCARFMRLRKKAASCKFTYAVPELSDGTCPSQDDLTLAYLEVAQLTKKYEELEEKIGVLSTKEADLEKDKPQIQVSPQVNIRMQKDGHGGSSVAGGHSGGLVSAPQTTTEDDERVTITITASLATDSNTDSEVKTDNKRQTFRNRKARSTSETSCHSDIIIDSVRVSRGSEHRSTVSKTSDDDPASENFVKVSSTYNAEVDYLREENKVLETTVSRLQERLDKLESTFEELLAAKT